MKFYRRLAAFGLACGLLLSACSAASPTMLVEGNKGAVNTAQSFADDSVIDEDEYFDDAECFDDEQFLANDEEERETEMDVCVNEVNSEVKAKKTALRKLHVDGSKLVDSKGKQVQLRGVSTHGIAWYPQFVNQTLFNELKEDWGANVVRLAMYTAEPQGYCTGGDKEGLKKLIKDGVKYAKKAGLYAIVDWHILSDNNPEMNEQEAIAFFDEMSKALSKYNNVLYEICNEPNSGTSWATIKGYAERVIPVIRANHKDAVILVGTPNWSQFVLDAAADPITKYDNICYTLHFYAATHKDDLRNNMVKAYEAGLPIFVSEFGICDASGNGALDKTSANKWIKTLDKYGISYVCWNMANKDESSSFFKASCTKTSGFKTSDMNDEAKWLYKVLRKRAGLSK